MLRWKYSRPLLGVLLLITAIGPAIHLGFLAEPGMQQTLAVAFLYGALALTYDLLFGFTGLLSFGHAVFDKQFKQSNHSSDRPAIAGPHSISFPGIRGFRTGNDVV